MGMRAEVIIAVRGETPANLGRTIANVRRTITADDGICIVFDGGNQPDYSKTIPASVRTITPYDSPRGCGQARHAGIETSKAGVVVLIDGHMQFPAGWLDTICAHLKTHGRDVTCAHMQSLGHDWTEIQGQHYSGAYIAAKCHEDGNQYWALAAKWNRAATADSGQIGAPMGACYGMRRRWYASMGAPLQLLEAWGGDEELLALCGWLCGGRTWLLPITCGHVYAAPRVMRVGTHTEDNNVWANRLAIIKATPGGPADLESWMRQSGLPWHAIDAQCSERADRINALRAHLAKQKRTFTGFFAAGWAKELTDNERTAEHARPRVAADAERSRRPARTPTPNQTHSPIPPTFSAARPAQCPACDNYGTLQTRTKLNGRPIRTGPEVRCTRCGHRVRQAA